MSNKLNKNTKVLCKSVEWFNLKGKVFRDYGDSEYGIVLVDLFFLKKE